MRSRIFGKTPQKGFFMENRIIEEAGDVDGLVEMLFEAALTERRLPGVLKKKYKVVWPDIPPDPNLAFGYNEARLSLGNASAAEIDRYDRMLLATHLLDGEDAKILWAAAHSQVNRDRGPAWRQSGRLLGKGGPTVKRRFERAILTLWFRLQSNRGV